MSQTVTKYRYKCKCGHSFYRDEKKSFFSRGLVCTKCGKRKVRFIKKILKEKREQVRELKRSQALGIKK